MELTVGDRPVRPITADEAMETASAGIIREDEHVELLHGVLTATTQQKPPHALVVQRLTRWLAPVLVAGACDVRVQLPLRVPDETSLPEPDIAVVERIDETAHHPATARLVIEVAYSSLHVDTRIKPALYASAVVPEYWLVDVKGRRVERYRDPVDGGYAARTAHHEGGSLTPAALDAPPLALAELFRGV